MAWFWLGVLPTVLYLLILCFTKACIDESLDNFLVIMLLLFCWIPCINWALIIAGLVCFMVEYENIPLKDNKLNRWLFKSHFE